MLFPRFQALKARSGKGGNFRINSITQQMSIKAFALAFLVSSCLLYANRHAQADCTRWHPHHCGVNDIRREIDNCINGGGCSLPADEA
ncbi:MAG: hypothetical protein GDA48_02110 [Hormoscilla sp. GM102CHS1]|nr:hypothetical protein [Hormoscilla sp. GM102CHS1]